jgi:YfiH family protein
VWYIANLRHDPFISVTRGGLAWLECRDLARFPWLVQAFSTRRQGVVQKHGRDLNLGFTAGERRTQIERNRRRFLAQIGASQFALAALRQIHSGRAFLVERDADGNLVYCPSGFSLPARGRGTLLPGDALLTCQAGILLSVRTADCLPLLLVDPQRRAVAAVHAGWRGALARVIEKAVGEMRRLFGSRPEKLHAALGPAIRACCYEVGEEVVDAFQGNIAHAERFFFHPSQASALSPRPRALSLMFALPPGHGPDDACRPHLDLVAVARQQLRSGGLAARNIVDSGLCTACRTDLFYSYRREGSRAGRLMAVIGIRPEDLVSARRRRS